MSDQAPDMLVTAAEAARIDAAARLLAPKPQTVLVPVLWVRRPERKAA